MKPNIVVFGPAHSGKSTLVGYLVAKSASEFDLKAELAGIRRELGDAYEPDQALAYLIDDTKEERFVDSKQDRRKLRRTLHVHTKYVNIVGNKIVVFDTPGSPHRSRERVRAQYHGNVGVFVAEVGDIIKRKALTDSVEDFLAPLFTWKQLQGNACNFVVVLSKCDKIDFERSMIEVAVEEMRKLLRGDKDGFSLVPIAIDVERITDKNVLTAAPELDWLKGPTLINALQQIAQEQNKASDRDSLLFNVFKVLELDQPGLIAEGKVLRGSLTKGARVILAPVWFNNQEYKALEAVASTLRHVKEPEDLDSLDSGDVGSVLLSDLRIQGTRVDRHAIDKIPTTCAFSPGEPILMGSILRFDVRDPLHLDHLDLLQQVKLLWFGRTIEARVVKCGPGTELFLETVSIPVALPMRDNKPAVVDFLILGNNNIFIQTILREFGDFGWLGTRKADFAEHTEIFANLQIKKVDGALIFEAGTSTAEEILRKLLRVVQRVEGEAHLSSTEYDIGIHSRFLTLKSSGR